MKKQYPEKTLNTSSHVPTRLCLGCRSRAPVSVLIRLAVTFDGRVLVDDKRNIPGRGAWIHTSKSCLDKGLRPMVLERAFKRRIDLVRVPELRNQLME
ncbi:MAG: YlxR family protein [Deltaproteobacteria bacterium]|nr:YlxR family protein [Deltaproteobacteria bacterium]